jgi:hypothetical protein
MGVALKLSRPSGQRAALEALNSRTGPVSLATEKALPLLGALAPLFPDAGLRRGTTVAVGQSGSMSLGMALSAAASAAGSWVAVVAEQLPNAESVVDLGVCAERLVMVKPTLPLSWATAVATLLDGVDIVVLIQPPRLAAPVARRLTARVRERGAVLIVVGESSAFEPEVRLTVVDERWDGLGVGYGHLRARRLTVEATGRRAASRPRRCVLQFPDAQGFISAVELASPAPPSAAQVG